MSFVLKEAPSSEPVSVEELIDNLDLDCQDDDLSLEIAVQSAREMVEKVTGVPLINQSWTGYFDKFTHCMALKPQTTSIVSIKYIDISGAQQELGESVYELSKNSIIPEIRLSYGQSWPSVRSHPDSVEIEFECGYGDESAVPAPLKQSILLLAAHWIENKEATTPLSLNELPLSVDFLLRPFKVLNL